MNSQQAQRNGLFCNNKLDLNAGFTGVRIKFGMENSKNMYLKLKIQAPHTK